MIPAAPETPTARTAASCRICGSCDLEVYLDLGMMPLVNHYLSSPDETATENRFPLAIAHCTQCWLSQLTCVVPPGLLFSNYSYYSSVSTTFRSHCAEMADRLADRFGLDGTSRILEIASNDGCLQGEFLARGLHVVGVEPASNLAEAARERGFRVINRFWGAEARKEAGGNHRWDLVLATNVLAHVDDLHDFLAQTAAALAPEGIFVFEVPYLRTFLTRTEFDTTYHEHLSYFLLTPLARVLRDHGLEVFEVEEYEIHGGSIRVHAGRSGAHPVGESVRHMLRMEEDLGFLAREVYRQFRGHVELVRDELRIFLEGLLARDRSIAAYGASAKGTILLNYCRFTTEQIRFVMDDTPAKQGKFCPGTGIPIVPRSHLDSHRVDYLLLLAWNFADELMSRLPGYSESGGRFLIPIPALRVL